MSFDVPPQEILTKDSVTISVDAVVYYKITNPKSAVCNVENYSESTKLLASTTLRTILGTRNMSEILSERENLANDILQHLDPPTDPWGIKVNYSPIIIYKPFFLKGLFYSNQVERVEVKDVRLPQQLQRAMAAEAEATREARAKVIAAEGEHKAAKALKEASDIISESPTALQLRYLQTLTHISAEKNSTIIFPLPLELMRGMISGKS